MGVADLSEIIRPHRAKGAHICVGGDFNAVWDFNGAREGGAYSNVDRERRDALRAFADQNGITSALHAIHPCARAFSFSRGKSHSLIDHVLVSTDVLAARAVEGCGLHLAPPPGGSDHQPIYVRLDVGLLSRLAGGLDPADPAGPPLLEIEIREPCPALN